MEREQQEVLQSYPKLKNLLKTVSDSEFAVFFVLFSSSRLGLDQVLVLPELKLDEREKGGYFWIHVLFLLFMVTVMLADLRSATCPSSFWQGGATILALGQNSRSTEFHCCWGELALLGNQHQLQSSGKIFCFVLCILSLSFIAGWTLGLWFIILKKIKPKHNLTSHVQKLPSSNFVSNLEQRICFSNKIQIYFSFI